MTELVLERGLRETRGVLARWNRAPGPVLRPWLIGATAVAVTLLVAVAVIAALTPPDPTPLHFPGLTREGTQADVVSVVGRNLLVLALHALACVAGFIAGSSLPREAQRYSGLWRTIHDRAGPAAIAFVGAATTFSLVTQAYVLGGGASSLAAQGGMPPWLLLVGLLPHALPELIALFLPLAAWLVASRQRETDELLAATFVTVAIALPVLVAAAFVEVFVSPHLVLALRSLQFV